MQRKILIMGLPGADKTNLQANYEIAVSIDFFARRNRSVASS
jgi:hypothetical protein